jgi:hypothetical protein
MISNHYDELVEEAELEVKVAVKIQERKWSVDEIT